MLNTRHNLNLPPYPDKVGLCFDFTFFNSFYRNFLSSFFVDS